MRCLGGIGRLVRGFWRRMIEATFGRCMAKACYDHEMG
jgi:hypothetical protein